MSLRPLATLCALTLCDFLLWHFSLAGESEPLSLLAGLTLPPLLVVCLWLLALNAVRILGSAARSRAARLRGRARRAQQPLARELEELQFTAPAPLEPVGADAEVARSRQLAA